MLDTSGCGTHRYMFWGPEFLAAPPCTSILCLPFSHSQTLIFWPLWFRSLCCWMSCIKRWKRSACRLTAVNIKSATRDELTLCSVCHAAPERQKETSQTDGCWWAADISGKTDWCSPWKGVRRCVWCYPRQMHYTDSREVEDFLGWRNTGAGLSMREY